MLSIKVSDKQVVFLNKHFIIETRGKETYNQKITRVCYFNNFFYVNLENDDLVLLYPSSYGNRSEEIGISETLFGKVCVLKVGCSEPYISQTLVLYNVPFVTIGGVQPKELSSYNLSNDDVIMHPYTDTLD
jgi:hypothetical protein